MTIGQWITCGVVSTFFFYCMIAAVCIIGVYTPYASRRTKVLYILLDCAIGGLISSVVITFFLILLT